MNKTKICPYPYHCPECNLHPDWSKTETKFQVSNNRKVEVGTRLWCANGHKWDVEVGLRLGWNEMGPDADSCG